MAKKRHDGEVNFYLGKGVSVEGVLNFSGQARLDGELKGVVQGSGTVLVGPTADLNAKIKADNIIISGKVTGDVFANQRLELKKPGSLSGDVCAPLVMMEEGVVFEGNCKMANMEDSEDEGGLKLLSTQPSATAQP